MLKESDYVKIRVTVPKESLERVRQALGDAGAGKIGNYSHCSFTYPVLGRFKPNEHARPAIGEAGKLETVVEEMLEVICHKDKVVEVIEAIRKVHPYEEPVIDILPRYELK